MSIERILSRHQNDIEITATADVLLEKRRDSDGRPHSMRHIRTADLRSKFPLDLWDSYFKLVFVRSPWEWTASNYRYNHRHERPNELRLEVRHVNEK